MTAGLLAGIAFGAHFGDGGLVDVGRDFDIGDKRGLRTAAVPAATTEPTEPLGVGIRITGGGVEGCFGRRRQNCVFGGGNVGALGCSRCFGGGAVGCLGCSRCTCTLAGALCGAGDGAGADCCVCADGADFDVTLCCASVARKGTSAVNAPSFAERSCTASRLFASWIWLMILCRVDLDYIGPYASLKHL